METNFKQQYQGDAEEENKNEPKMFKYQLDLENVPTIGNIKLNWKKYSVYADDFKGIVPDL